MRAEEAIKNAPTDVLCAAAKTLQEAHDWVEGHEFNINTYGNQKDAISACYIGSVRHVCGETSIEPYEDSMNESSALALASLDLAAISFGADPNDHQRSEDDYNVPALGTVAEHFGFAVKEEAMDMGWGDGEGPTWRKYCPPEKPAALEVYRQALREMHTELMSREAVPA